MTFLISADLSQGRARAPSHQAPAWDLSPVPASQAPAADDLAENGAPRLLSGSLSGPSPPPLPLPQCPAETSALCRGILHPLPDQLALPSVQPTPSRPRGPGAVANTRSRHSSVESTPNPRTGTRGPAGGRADGAQSVAGTVSLTPVGRAQEPQGSSPDPGSPRAAVSAASDTVVAGRTLAQTEEDPLAPGSVGRPRRLGQPPTPLPQGGRADGKPGPDGPGVGSSAPVPSRRGGGQQGPPHVLLVEPGAATSSPAPLEFADLPKFIFIPLP